MAQHKRLRAVELRPPVVHGPRATMGIDERIIASVVKPVGHVPVGAEGASTGAREEESVAHIGLSGSIEWSW